MRHKFLIRALLAGVAVASLTSASAGATGGRDDQPNECRPSRGLLVTSYALTADHQLACFREHRAGKLRVIAPISGLQTDTRLVGIDFRPANGLLYGVGDQGGVYTIDLATGVASGRVQINQPLSGASFGVDFNPTVDRLRIVSDAGQNLRVNVVDGSTTVDGPLNYLGPPAVNPALGVAGAAYTNNDNDPTTATTLYDIDSALDQVVVQAPPNAGTLNPTGKLRVDTDATVGFDIFSYVVKGVTEANRAFASLTVNGTSQFHEVDVLTGAARYRGTFPRPVADIAVPTNQG